MTPTPRKAVVLAAVMLAALGTPGVHVSLAADAAPASVEELNQLSALIGRTLSAEEVAAIEAKRGAGPEVAAMRSALLYRADPLKHRAEFEASFTVDDYASRARNETTDITQEELKARMKAIESTHPTLQAPARMLVLFVQSRNANQWFALGGQRLSVARFLRGAVFAQVFAGSALDPRTIANELDRSARARYESGR